MRAELPKRPRLGDGLELVDGPGDTMQLRGVHPPLRLAGRLALSLLPLLDGTRSIDELSSELRDWSEREITGALRSLAARGLLDDGPKSWPKSAGAMAARSQAAFYRSATFGPSDRGRRILKAICDARIDLFGRGRLAAEIATMLRRCGSKHVTVTSSLPSEPDVVAERISTVAGSDLILLALPRPEPALAAAINAACLENGLTWLPVVVDGVQASIGPMVIPGSSPCYHCFRRRIRSNTHFPDDEAAYEAYLDTASPNRLRPEWPPFTTSVAAWAVMEAIRLVGRFAPPVTVGRVCMLDARSGAQRVSPVWKLPRCVACSRAMRTDGGGAPPDPKVGDNR